MTDVTNHEQTEARLLRSQRMESIGTLAGGIAHDLNNLLAPILLGTTLLKRQVPPEQAAAILADIESCARRGAGLLRQLLTFARGGDGEHVTMGLSGVVREVEAIVQNTFPKNIDLQTHVPEDLWSISGDPTQLCQVLMNLCVNARDAMPRGGQISLSAGNVELDDARDLVLGVKPGRYVRIEVSDTGTGIPPEIIDRIFEPFFSTHAISKSTGLGLSSVLAIVRGHEGWVSVHSELGAGSVFEVHLPALQAEPVAFRAAPSKDEMPCGNGETILVVDDEAAVLAVTSQTLALFGYRVLAAADGAKAIEQLALYRGRIAAVLTNMMMPEVDGPALIATLGRTDPTIPVVAISGMSSGDFAHTVTQGLRHFLHKPCSTSELLVAMRNAMEATAEKSGSRPPS